MAKRLIRLAQPLFLVLALVFIGLLVRAQWTELSAYEWRLHAGWLLLSGSLLIGSAFVEVAMWRTILGWVGGRLGYVDAARIWFASILVRYIPGNIWQPLGMTVLAQERGVRAAATVASIAIYQAVSLLSVIPFLSGYLLAGGNIAGVELPMPAPWLAILITAPVLILLGRPAWLIGALNLALVRLKRAPLTTHLGSGQLLPILLAAMGNWLLWGVAFTALTLSLHTFDPAHFRQVASLLLVAYPIAYAIGYVSFLTPGGLAVREGALVLLLLPVLGSVVTVAALAMRLWQVVLELLVVVIVMIRRKT
jgi:hypothetical protein